ncbi:hypothetical protein AMAG_04673 [Allomyces macrogynus ATCC 38327]|uniref:Phosphatidylinositol N-acetylglucosaminyltransferase subunit H conserved domain-containing protein n=1 Tax=Allomyces macrogynus (strain ATCC 38327) TaxID=578462 RepID=A0A0L0S5Y1_ALLM3|nr:hypothetical protein AMAG_04673 [Allomyces macrogynus ATCC 38327]|eukprot:KNE57826.1 hypothetical protein AMAG_04673 [Allomyces macrogynus ATCC 38327]
MEYEFYNDVAEPARPTPERDVNELALLPLKMRAVLMIQPQGDDSRVYHVECIDPHASLLWRVVRSLILWLLRALAVSLIVGIPSTPWWSSTKTAWPPQSAVPGGLLALVLLIYWQWSRGRVHSASMTVLRGVAIQLDTFARNGVLITTRLLPMRQVRGLFIHEVLTMGRIATVLALAVDGDRERPLQLVFDAVPLRLVQQQAILRDFTNFVETKDRGEVEKREPKQKDAMGTHSPRRHRRKG